MESAGEGKFWWGGGGGASKRSSRRDGSGDSPREADSNPISALKWEGTECDFLGGELGMSSF